MRLFRILVFITLMALALSLVGCSSSVSVGVGGHGAITGYIVTLATSQPRLVVADGMSAGKPVQGAVVLVTGTNKTTTTDASGQFLVSGLSPGEYDLVVTYAGISSPLKLENIEVIPGGITNIGRSEPGKGFALLVGINDYKNLDSTQDLKNAETDVAQLSSALSNSIATQVTTLTGSRATKESIKRAIEKIGASMTPNDHFVFFFSGHGGAWMSGSLNNMEFIVPWEGIPDESIPGAAGTMVSDTDIASWLKSYVPSAKVTVVLDSCYSGSFANGNSSPVATAKGSVEGLANAVVNPESSVYPVMRALRNTPYVLLAASRQEEKAYEKNGGALTLAMVEALTSQRPRADANTDGVIDARELWSYASAWCAASSWASKQHPYIWPEAGTRYAWPPIYRY